MGPKKKKYYKQQQEKKKYKQRSPINTYKYQIDKKDKEEKSYYHKNEQNHLKKQYSQKNFRNEKYYEKKNQENSESNEDDKYYSKTYYPKESNNNQNFKKKKNKDNINNNFYQSTNSQHDKLNYYQKNPKPKYILKDTDDSSSIFTKRHEKTNEVETIQKKKYIEKNEGYKKYPQEKKYSNNNNSIFDKRSSSIQTNQSSSSMQFTEVILSDESFSSQRSRSENSQQQIYDSLKQFQLQFESSELLPSQQGLKYQTYIQNQYGADIQRILKQQINKQYKNRQKIETISQLKFIIDKSYPIIELKFKINQKQFTVNLIDFFKKMKYDKTNDYKQNFETILRKIFYRNYDQMKSEQISKLYCFIQKRLTLLQMKSCIGFNEKDQVAFKYLLSCCMKISHKKINFLFMGYDYNQIRFSNIFIQNHQSLKSSSYEYYLKKIKPKMDQEEKNQKKKQKLKIQDSQISSDEDKKYQQKYSIKNVKKNLEQILNQDEQQFQNEIEKKEEIYQELLEKDDNKEQLEKIMEQIKELSSILEDYKISKQSVSNQYHRIRQDNTKQNNIILLYKKIKMLNNQLKSKLPIIARKKDLLELLKKQNLIILKGETGSGKSTQLPQILCQYYNAFQDQSMKPILLTQPRKIATRSIAQRVAQEMGQKVHGFVDYLASSNGKVNPKGKIIFMLDRLLLDELQKDPSLSNYSCLVIDQAHQRTISIDVIIGFIKNILKNRNNFKVIITSATLDAGLFQKYFNAHTFQVSGRLYPVQIEYKPYDKIKQSIQKIYKCVMEEILVDSNKIKKKYEGHILIFCPTVDQINRLCLKFNNQLNKKNFLICPLHGKLSIQEQKLVFSQQKRTKIILASRIAETAVTIDKVKVVIDLGEDRQNTYNPIKKISEFKLCPISRSAAKQRAGRAGRTTNGYCFRLYSPAFFKDSMKANKKPEIQSLPLDILVLRLKQLQIKDILKFEYLSKPNQQSLKVSLQSMQMIGCLDDNYQITQIGKSLVQIPIQPFLSRAIIQALMIQSLKSSLNIADDVIKILCIIVNNQNLFTSKEQTRQKCQQNKYLEFSDEKGDFFSLLHIYQDYQKIKQVQDQKDRKDRKKNIGKWCKNNFLNSKTLYQTEQLYKQVKGLVSKIYIDFKKYPQYKKQIKLKLSRFEKRNDLILSCLITSFCQNLCLYSGNLIIGYTLLSQKISINIYGTSFLALQGITPKWIVCYDIINTSQIFCRIAQQVDFQLLRNSISPKIFEKYHLDDYQKCNPFYRIIIKQLPTIILDQFDYRYRIGDERTYFLNSVKVIKNKQKNRMEFYYEIDNQQNQNLQEKINQFVQILTQDKDKKYMHRYRGTISAIFDTGCIVERLILQTNGFVIRLSGVPLRIQPYLYQQYKNTADQIQCIKDKMTLCFSNIDIYQYIKQSLNNQILLNPQLSEIKIITQNSKRKEKIMSIVIKVSFFCSQLPSDTIYLNYNHKYLQEITHSKQMNQQQINYTFEKFIILPIEKYFKRKYIARITKKINGILLIYNNRYIQEDVRKPTGRYEKRKRQSQQDRITFDEVEIMQQLKKIWKNQQVFYLPKFASKEREVDTNQGNKSIEYWQKQIKKLFPDAIDLQLKRTIHPKYFIEDYYTNFTATFSLQSIKNAEKYKKSYDKKKGVLGTQKLHVQLLYKQTITKVSYQVYNVFKIQYENHKNNFSKQEYSIQFIERVKKFQNRQYILIECVSDNPQLLIEPTIIIDQLFKPHLIPLQESMIKILQKKNNNWIFQKIELKYEYKIYFQYQKFSYNLKLYCKKEQFNKIEKDFLKEMDSFRDITIKISYRGKNLNKALDILKDIKSIYYEVKFQEKLIILQGNQIDVYEIKNQIQKLVNNQLGDCRLCQNILLTPYKLYNCSHQFCRYCIIELILSWKKQYRRKPLKCPFSQFKNGKQSFCRDYISMYDLKYLFEQEQFNDICDIAIRNLVDQKKYHGCFTYNCDQIFEVQVSKKQNIIDCKLCNKKYCYKCKQISHNQQGICQYKIVSKQCKRCKQIIIKTQSDYVTCSNCKINICWICERMFKQISDYRKHYQIAHSDE